MPGKMQHVVGIGFELFFQGIQAGIPGVGDFHQALHAQRLQGIAYQLFLILVTQAQSPFRCGNYGKDFQRFRQALHLGLRIKVCGQGTHQVAVFRALQRGMVVQRSRPPRPVELGIARMLQVQHLWVLPVRICQRLLLLQLAAQAFLYGGQVERRIVHRYAAFHVVLQGLKISLYVPFGIRVKG